MRKIGPIGRVQRVERPPDKPDRLVRIAEPNRFLAEVDTLIDEQPQPFPHQGGASFRRVHPVAGRLVGRAHRAVLVEIETGAVSVAIGRIVEGCADLVADDPVDASPQGNLVDLHERAIVGRGDLARIEAVLWIERLLDLLKAGIEIAEEFRHIF